MKELTTIRTMVTSKIAPERRAALKEIGAT